MAELSIKMTSEDQQAAAAVQRLTDGIKEADSAFEKTVATSHKAAQAARDAAQAQSRQASEGARLAQNLIRQNETLEERYRRQRIVIDEAHRDGKIGAEQHARAVDLLNRQVADAAEASRAQARAINQVTTEQKELETVQHRTVSEAAIGKIGRMAAGYLSISSAISLARQALEAFNTERTKGQSETERLQESRRNLLQVSEGDYAALEKQADAAAIEHVVERSVARQVRFSARSEGFERDFDTVMAVSPLLDPLTAARVAGQTNTIFGNKYSTEQILSGAYYASKVSRLDFTPLVAEIPTAAEGAALAGASAAETLAAVSVLPSTIDQAGIRIRDLYSKIAIDKGEAPETEEEFAARQKKEHDRAVGQQRELRALEESLADKQERLARFEGKRGRRSEADLNRLDDLRTDVERQQRAISEFDRSGLAEQALVRKQGRESLAGLRMYESLDRMAAWSEEQRQEFLGRDQGKNLAYMLLIRDRKLIEQRAVEIEAEMARAGTPESLINQRLQEIRSDPLQSSFREAQQAKIKNQVASETAYSADINEIEAYREWVNTEKAEGRIGFLEWAGERARIWATRMSGSTLEGGLGTDERIDTLYDRYLIEAELKKQTELLEQIANGVVATPATPSGPTLNGVPIPITRPGEDK